jgi:excisionase family DNA binding protein
MDVGERLRLVPVAEGAAYAGVHPKTIRRYISDGRLTSYRVGVKFIRVDLDEIDDVFAPRPVRRAS